MFAVVKTGGKQYKVAKDDVIRVEKLDAEAGNSVALTDVLMIGDGSDLKVGAPYLEGAAVTAQVLEQARGEKLLVFKKKRRQNYRRKNGHRQDLTVLRITDIQAKGAPKTAAKAKTAAPKPAAEAAPAAEAETKPKAPAKTAKADKPEASAAKAAPKADKPAAKAKAPAKKPAAKKTEE